MIVSKLIERLQSFPGDLEVWIDSYGDQAMYTLSAASLETVSNETIIILEHIREEDADDRRD